VGVVNPTEPIAVTVVTASTAEPLTVTEIKNHLRVGSTHENALISSYGIAARDYYERETGRALMPQTMRLTLQDFPVGAIELPRSPVSTASTDVTVKYFEDGSTSLTTFPSSKYIVDHEHEPAQLRLQRDESWPTAELRSRNAIQVDFKAGYGVGSTGNPAALVPSAHKLAIRVLAAHFFENREPVPVGTVARELPFSLRALIDMHRVVRFG
jgi:uncharacterized phiE125 gp8 family phage protein